MVDESAAPPHRERVLPAFVPARRAPLRHALVLLTVVAAFLAVAASALGAATYPDHALIVAAYPVVGLAFVGVGCFAWHRRPTNGTGALLAITGVLIMAASLQNTGDPNLLIVGLLFGQTPIAATLHLVLAFPGGRVTHRLDRVLVAAGYVITVFIELPVAFPGALDALHAVDPVVTVVKLTVLLSAAARAVWRLRSAGLMSSERRVFIAVSLYGGGLLAFFIVSARILAPWWELDEFGLFALQMSVFVTAPFVFAAGVTWGGFARTGELTELVAWLGTRDARRVPLRDALAAVLGDQSLTVLYTRPGSGTLIDAAGQAASSPASRTRGTVVVVGADGQTPSATLSYDSTLIADPTVVEQAGRVVALALERERLDAELLAEREALRASRTRVVEVGDLTRRQLAQDLHDVLQSRLTLAAIHAGRLAATSAEPATRAGATQLRDELDALITEFRGVVHGVMPALLVERGLAAAAEDLVDRQPVPAQLFLVGADALPPALATTAYFILAEALTNAVRHAAATTLAVTIEQRDGALLLEVRDDGVGGATPSGAGLRGIADRVGAHAGRLHVESPVGGGTRLRVELPCAS